MDVWLKVLAIAGMISFVLGIVGMILDIATDFRLSERIHRIIIVLYLGPLLIAIAALVGVAAVSIWQS